MREGGVDRHATELGSSSLIGTEHDAWRYAPIITRTRDENDTLSSCRSKGDQGEPGVFGVPVITTPAWNHKYDASTGHRQNAPDT